MLKKLIDMDSNKLAWIAIVGLVGLVGQLYLN